MRESGHEEEVTTLNETIKDYRFDDKDDGVLFSLSGPGIDKDKDLKWNANVARNEERMRNHNNERWGDERAHAGICNRVTMSKYRCPH